MHLTMFYLPHCPHCRLALNCIDELKRENARYADVTIDLVDESKARSLADDYDYWYVPCFFLGREKLHEGHAEKGDVRAVLERALG